MQYFAWNNNGAVIYYCTSIYKNNFQYENKKSFLEEKDLFYDLDNLLAELNINFNSKKGFSSFFIKPDKNII